MPIKVVSKKACAKMMMEQSKGKFGEAYTFTKEDLVHWCGEIIEICRQHTEQDPKPTESKQSA